MSISDETSLGKALKEERDTIEIEGDLANKVIKIKATGTVAWAVAFGAIAVAVGLLMVSGGTSAPVSGIVGAGAVGILGLPAALSAVSIAVAAGGVGALNSLRTYEIVNQRNGKLTLKRK